MRFLPWLPLAALGCWLGAACAGAQVEAPEARPQGLDQAGLEALAAEIAPQVAELRGLEFLRPVAVKVADRESVARYTRERMDAMDSPAERLAAERLAKLLGLLPADFELESFLVEFLNRQAGGFYDPGRDTFYLLEGLDRSLASSVIAHEFVHALEDQHYDLGGLLEARRDDADQAAAVHALLEGSALSIGNLWMSAHLGPGEMMAVARAAAEQSQGLFEAPLAVWKPMLCSYFQGLAFLRRLESPQQALLRPLSLPDLEAAFARLPRSTEQVLHPDKYWRAGAVDAPTAIDYRARAAAAVETWAGTPAEFRWLREDTQGEAAIALLFDADAKRSPKELERLQSRLTFSNGVAAGWDGDRLVLFETAPGENYLHWTSVWDSPAEAEQFRAAIAAEAKRQAAAGRALGAALPGSAVRLEGATVTFELWTSPAARPKDPALLFELEIRADPAQPQAPAADSEGR